MQSQPPKTPSTPLKPPYIKNCVAHSISIASQHGKTLHIHKRSNTKPNKNSDVLRRFPHIRQRSFLILALWKEQKLLLILPSNGSHSLKFANCRVVRRIKREIVNQRSTQRKIHLKLQRKFNFKMIFSIEAIPRSRRVLSKWISFLMFSWTIANDCLCFFVLFCIPPLLRRWWSCDTALKNGPKQYEPDDQPFFKVEIPAVDWWKCAAFGEAVRWISRAVPWAIWQ